MNIGKPENNHIHSSNTINRLVVLPFRKSFEISFQSIRVRFFRSMITILSLSLAISFLSFVLVGTDVANGLLSTQDPGLRQKLIRSGYDLKPDDTQVGSSPKQKWIVMLSLLVCVVGIINAQLMAVTERFREIGTMKCLGALDGFILGIFIIEAGIQGLVGAGAGAFIGGLFAVINTIIRFGSVSITLLPMGDVAMSIAIATGVGFLLSLLGVLYPAFVASKMQPVEALRTEQ